MFLSYLTGLGPVGEPIEPRLDWAMADLGYRQKVSVYRCLGQLIASGFVEKVATGSGGTVGLLIVRRRLERLDRRPPPEPDPDEDESASIGAGRIRPNRVTPLDWAARLAEMPDDTRGLTARVFGDPIPNDQRRRRYAQGRGHRISLHAAGASPASAADSEVPRQASASRQRG